MFIAVLAFATFSLWRRLRTGRRVVWLDIVLEASGWAALAFALSPLVHHAADEWFAWHMIQHELLMVVAAPLLVASRAMHHSALVLPRRIARPVLRALVRLASMAFVVMTLHAVAIWAWHVPAVFDAVVTNDALHHVQHATFFGTAILFWWSVLWPRRRSARGRSVLSLFVTTVHTGILGALLTFSRHVWYAPYANHPLALEDQQWAGLVMWIPGGVAYLVAALIVARRWLIDSDAFAAADERPSTELLV